MGLTPIYTKKIRTALNVFSIIASLILIVSISLEVFGDNPFATKSNYLKVQLFVCLYFIADFVISLCIAENKWQFFRRYFFILLMAIPYLYLIPDVHLRLNPEQIYFVSLIPLVRGAAALVFIVTIVVRHNTTALFISYLIFLLSVFYFLTLVFFVVEHRVNPEVHSYAEALWWGAMTITTLGSNILPVTIAGKFITTGMALVGLTIFPIFTAYITTLVNRIAHNEFVAKRANQKLDKPTSA